MKRAEQREWLVRLCYQLAMNEPENESLDELLELHELPTNNSYLRQSLQSLRDHRQEIDREIETHLGKRRLSDIKPVDLAILRVAVDEMLFSKLAPVSVVINESVEIAKTYSEENAYKFINGVLAAVTKGSDHE